MAKGALSCIGSVLAFCGLLTASAGPARAIDQSLVDAAKKEGHVTWYTTKIVNQLVRPLADGFQKKYGIKVDYVRANSGEVALRILNEGRAGHMQADVFDGSDAAASLKKQNLVLKWLPEAAANWPKELHDPEGYWVATNLYVLTPGFNTDLVPRGTQPRTWDDLLDPKWKGKMVWSSAPEDSSGPGFVGLVLTQLGQEKGMAYLKKLSQQKVSGMSAAARQVLDQVIAGEYSIALQIFNNHPGISAAQGAPCDWIAMNPAMGVFSVISVTSGSPHPNAAKLFVDFATSTEGQKIWRDAQYIPADPRVPPADPALRPDGDKFKAIYFTPEQLDDQMPAWAGVFKQLFQ